MKRKEDEESTMNAMNKEKIILEIEKESDLYCPFNSDRELSEDITSYLLRKTGDKGVKNHIVIKIISKEPVNEENVRNAFEQRIASYVIEMKRISRLNTIKQAWMLGVGVAFIALSIFLQKHVDRIFFTVLSTIGAFAIWEAAAIWIVHNPKLRIQTYAIDKWTKGLEFEFEVRE